MAKNSVQRQLRHVLINDSNVNTNIVVKHHYILHNASMWHKMIVSNCENLDIKYVLKTIMDSVYPHDFIPVNFVKEDTAYTFLIKNCPGVIKQICQQNLIVANPLNVEKPFKFSIILGFATTQEIKVNMEDKISAVIKKRFNTETKVLNLDSFYKDAELEEFCPLSQPKILLFVLHMCKAFPFLTLKLSNNEIRTLDALDALMNLRLSFVLDLKNNLIENEKELHKLQPMLISDLILEGNPICEKKNEIDYIKMVKHCCPNAKKIDGIFIWNGFQPFRRNFICNLEGKEIIDQFLEYYFTLYDTSNRNLLESIYHPDALFTLTSHYISGQHSSSNIRLMSYKKYSRNIKFMSNLSKCNEFVFKGPKKIIEILSDLPLSEHDPYSFTVDLIHYTENIAIFVVAGVYREPAETLSDSERYLGFSRTFALHQVSSEKYLIINEEMHVNNATTPQQTTAFKYTRLPATINIPIPKDEKERNELISAMKTITTLNKQWSKKCLEDTNYDLKNAISKFVDLFKSDEIPEDAFREPKEEIISRQPLNSTINVSAQNHQAANIISPKRNITPVSTKEVVTVKEEDSENDMEIEKDVKDNADNTQLTLISRIPVGKKNDYYSMQLRKICLAIQRNDTQQAIDIAKQMISQYPQDASGYRQMQQIYFHNGDVFEGRKVLLKARGNLPRKKYLNVLKSYYLLELNHGDPEHLITAIEKDKYQLKVTDYLVEYIKALVRCDQHEKAKEVAKNHIKVILGENRILSQIRLLEESAKIKLY